MVAMVSAIAPFETAQAAPKDFEFHLVESEIKQSNDAVVAVKLIDKRTGARVEQAVVFTTRMDMAPEGMEAMTTSVDVLPSNEPGIYRFKTNLTMAGGWRFSIAAKVQGEPDTVESRLEFKAVQ
ncbi:FixH family protein [Aminobacter anthyllidis]|nr:FixH family protein [Aminobacter anthyllidis]MDH4989168.1 FixH family protein [Aminobacter anthyllidis]